MCTDEPRFYYWESIECLRRLALTGFLLIFPMGSELQVVCACIISLVSMQLYVRFSPYMDDAMDKISTVAQLMTFTQLFGALLISVRAPALAPRRAAHARQRTSRTKEENAPLHKLSRTLSDQRALSGPVSLLRRASSTT